MVMHYNHHTKFLTCRRYRNKFRPHPIGLVNFHKCLCILRCTIYGKGKILGLIKLIKVKKLTWTSVGNSECQALNYHVEGVILLAPIKLCILCLFYDFYNNNDNNLPYIQYKIVLKIWPWRTRTPAVIMMWDHVPSICTYLKNGSLTTEIAILNLENGP